jgi:hypothetical protein
MVGNLNGSISRGGWEVKLTVMSDTDLILPMHLVHLWWEGIFGTGEGGDVPPGGKLAFQGHTLPQQFSFDVTGSLTTIDASTSDSILRLGWCQGIHFWDALAGARANYHQFSNASENLTMGRIVAHLLGYYDDWGVPPATNPDWVSHTNLVYHAIHNPHGWITLDHVTTEPFASPGNLSGSMQVQRYIVRETTNLWQRLQEIARNEFFVIYFDKTDTLWYTRHPMYRLPLPDPVMTFDNNFVIGRPTVTTRRPNQIRQVKLHAVTDEADTLHATYPASPVHVYGNVHDQSRIRCNDQDTLDEWARTYYLFQNRDYTVRWTAPGLCGLLFELLDRVQITYTGTSANGVHIDWTNKKFWIHDITVTPGREFGGTSVFVLEAESV